MAEFRLETERLILRDWEDRDVEPFAEMCADPLVMKTLGPLMSRDQTKALIDRLHVLSEENGHTFWALERQKDGRFIGWCGIIRAAVNPIAYLPEVGWRLASDIWGQGYAREAAAASIKWAFDNLPDERVWAITSEGNHLSWGLMERLGMVRHPDMDFDHPHVADDSPLKRHVTYSIARSQS